MPESWSVFPSTPSVTSPIFPEMLEALCICWPPVSVLFVVPSVWPEAVPVCVCFPSVELPIVPPTVCVCAVDETPGL